MKGVTWLAALATISLVNSIDCSERSDLYSPHETDTNLYYLRKQNERILFSCPDNHIFNINSSTCTQNRETICPETPSCNVGDWGLLLPYPPDCSFYIYCDQSGKDVLSSCHKGLHFSIEDMDCVYPEQANCPFCVVFESPTTETITTIEPCPENPSCSVTDVGFYKPYPPDCSKYIYCDKEGPGRLRSCMKDFYFSPEQKFCTSLEQANCLLCAVTTLPPTTTISLCADPPTCIEGDTGLNKPYPSDCSLYIYCGGEIGAGELSICPLGQHFSPVELICLPEEEANCPDCLSITSTTVVDTSAPVATTPDLTTVPEATTMPEANTTPDLTTVPDTATTEVDTTEAATETTIGVCQAVSDCLISDIGFKKPYPPDCTKYVYCFTEGPGTVRKCPGGQHFSPESKSCMIPEEAHCPICYISTIATEPTTIETTIGFCPPTPTCSNEDEGLVKPYPPDCGLFIYCEEGGIESISLCPKGTHFSPDLNRCITPELAKCPQCDVYITTTESTTLAACSETPKCELSDFGLNKPYPPDCTKFIYCDAPGYGEISFCAPGQEFSHDLLRCVPAVEANCPICIEIVTTGEPGPTTVPNCPETPTSCLSSEIGLMKPFPPDCTKYIYCKAEGLGTLRSCPLDQEFDPILLYCAAAEEANCPYCQVSTTTDLPSFTDVTTSITYLQSSTAESSTEITTAITTEISIDLTTEVPTTTEDNCRLPTCLDGEIGSMKRYPFDCHMYIYCNLNVANPGQKRKCKTPQIFNPISMKCDADYLICDNCPEVKFLLNIKDEETTTMCSKTPLCSYEDFGSMKPYPPDCSMYIYCGVGGSSEMSSCPSGSHFSESSQRCVDVNLNICHKCVSMSIIDPLITKSPICPPSPKCTADGDGQLLPYPSDCAKYIYCENNVEDVSQCFEGYQFSRTLSRCVESAAADCQFCIEETDTYAQQQSQSKPHFWKFWSFWT